MRGATHKVAPHKLPGWLDSHLPDLSVLDEGIKPRPHGITFTDVKTFSCADRDQGYPCLFPIPALKDLWSLRLPHIAAIDPE